MKRVFQDEYFCAEIDFQARRIELTRSRLPFVDTAAMLRTAEAMMTAIRDEGVEDFSLLVDSTNGPTAAGRGYRKAFERFADYLAANFRRVAVVLESRESALAALETSRRPNIDFFVNRPAARTALSIELPS